MPITWHEYARTFGNCYVACISGKWVVYLPVDDKTAECGTLDDARKLAAEYKCGIIL